MTAIVKQNIFNVKMQKISQTIFTHIKESKTDKKLKFTIDQANLVNINNKMKSNN